MIRSLIIMILVFSSALAAIPTVPHNHSSQARTFAAPASQDPLNVTGSPYAFNYTYSQANLYTNSSAHFTPNATGTSFLWQNTVTHTKSNKTIAGSGFMFNVTTPNLPQGKEVGNYNLTVPQFNCKKCASVKVNFDFAGTLTKGTNASYTLSFTYNNTRIKSQAFTAPGRFQGNTAGCLQDFCIDVTKDIGYNLTLTFNFGWNTTETGMGARAGEIVVVSIGDFIQSTSNFMQLNSGQVVHTAKLFPISFNSTEKTTLQPSGSPSLLPWHIGIVSIYYPAGYTIQKISLNSTTMIQEPPISSEVPFETDHCFNGIPPCSQSLIALNVTDFTLTGATHNSTITIIANTPSSISQLTPVAAGVSTTFFSPSDTIGLKIVNKPSIINASTSQQMGNLNITFADPTGAPHSLGGQANPATALGGVFNFTISIPADCGFCGRWNVTAIFTSQFDLGIMFALFRVDQMRLSSFTSGGSNNGLAVQGTLAYANSSVPSGASGYVFAVDAGTLTNIPVTTTNSSSSGLYISNVTLVNGVFTQGQTLIMLFTVVNPTSPPQAFSANVTLQHEWPGPQTHGVSVTFPLGLGDGLGDLPFISGPQVYQAALTLTPSGVQLQLTSVNLQSHAETFFMSLGTSPVSPTREHAGLFKIIINSKTTTSSISHNTIESPPYAYVFGLPLAPSRYLAYSAPFTADTKGNFSPPAIKSDSILGAQKLVVFALAMDASGIILVNNPQNPGFSDSTILQSTTDKIDPVTEGQSVTTTLHLKSNSSKIIEVITIDLNLQGSGKVAEQTGISIAPGTSQDVTLSFKAPSIPGQYALSFSSPQYGGPLASQTLQVVILQSNLQILIPAGIGVVAAIIILGFYLVKRQPEKEVGKEEKTKPAASKTKPSGSGSPPSKSLTRTPDAKV